ncbi:unnamed protein product [Alopecurus aequalis]
MEATAMSMGKAMLDGALGYAKSKAAEQIALQLGVVRDVNFITNELQMMQSFLMTADEEQSKNKVLMTWVKQIGDLAYKVEDSLMDFGLHKEKKPFLGCIPRNPFDRRRIALEVKELRAEVEDVSNRNLRYRLIKESSGSKPTLAEEQASIAITALFGINEARFAALEHEKTLEVDLLQLITSSSVDRRVMAVWGTSGELGKTSAIQEVYDNPKVLKRFGFRAWIRLMRPFNSKEFLRNLHYTGCPTGTKGSLEPVLEALFLLVLVCKFYENSLDGLGKEEKDTSIGANVLMKMENMDQNELVHVFNAHVSSNSYLIVIDDLSTIVEWHCIKKYFPDNKKQSRIIVSTQQVEIASLCIEKPYQVSELKQLSSDQTIYLFHKKNSVEQVSMDSASGKMFTMNETSLASTEKEKSKHILPRPFLNNATTEKNTTVTTSEIQEEDQEPKNAGEDKGSNLTSRKRSGRSRTLPLVDELLCGQESEKSIVIELVGQADNDQDCKASMDSASAGIFEPNETRLAAMETEKQKVFKDKTEKKKDLIPAMKEQARLILKKCDGLPLAISTIAGFLATKPKTVVEWRKMSDGVSAELEINPELRKIKTILMRSYDGLPYHLKCVFLYLSIFPEDHRIEWGRLVRRWIAEGYSRDMHGMTAEEIGRRYFDELLDRSMILPGEGENHYSGKISSCQLHDIIREICISKAREENLVFTLEEGCCLSNTQGLIRHLVIGSNWKRDKDVLVSMLDLSHVRSLTVFGDWKPFFILDKMRFLRVLDLEDTLGLRDHHLDQIGQLLHLKYLSLRRCGSIYSLPHSLGNLRHLQALDVRGPLLLRPQILDDDLNRSNIVNLHRFGMANVESSGWNFRLCGVQIPSGIGKLKSLLTLRHVSIARGKGKVALKELKELTQLRKLGVLDVTTKNSMVLWSAIAGLNQVRSLSVDAVDYYDAELDGCLGQYLWPASCLESLKLDGKLVRMTAWIHQLQNLSKLTLQRSGLEQDDAIQALGVLPNLVQGGTTPFPKIIFPESRGAGA